jgi:hypothetical protein
MKPKAQKKIFKELDNAHAALVSTRKLLALNPSTETSVAYEVLGSALDRIESAYEWLPAPKLKD